MTTPTRAPGALVLAVLAGVFATELAAFAAVGFGAADLARRAVPLPVALGVGLLAVVGAGVIWGRGAAPRADVPEALRWSVRVTVYMAAGVALLFTVGWPAAATFEGVSAVLWTGAAALRPTWPGQ